MFLVVHNITRRPQVASDQQIPLYMKNVFGLLEKYSTETRGKAVTAAFFMIDGIMCGQETP